MHFLVIEPDNFEVSIIVSGDPHELSRRKLYTHALFYRRRRPSLSAQGFMVRAKQRLPMFCPRFFLVYSQQTSKAALPANYPYHVYVPSFGDGASSSSDARLRSPKSLPRRSRFVSVDGLPALVSFLRMAPAPHSPHQLNSQILSGTTKTTGGHQSIELVRRKFSRSRRRRRLLCLSLKSKENRRFVRQLSFQMGHPLARPRRGSLAAITLKHSLL